METKNLICMRNECPNTCFLMEQEGPDYCMICADACSCEEYEEYIQVLYEEQLLKIIRDEEYVCGRNENPETCSQRKQEGNDYCMICADRFTLEEYETIQRIGLPF